MAELDVNGVRLHYDVSGEGPPLVFVHGMCGRGQVWAGQVERLAGEFTCVIYDRRGHGMSTDGDAVHSVPLHGDDFAEGFPNPPEFDGCARITARIAVSGFVAGQLGWHLPTLRIVRSDVLCIRFQVTLATLI